ncbi:uncharacterized protein LOC122510581 [Leptopilina heterotoma]|uniref:uncharacterized protein LOC122510581 n=1 Tax=Leptopilina heterotoma TaxID=63436 RepID=UPI001CA9928D|nr:uncharacterized protein LOC122510581 [Leptopilina heterotoma]XP_043481283.1 uncharacterized protein LOC122510581 [Leptopilina heterotoma]XP_043481284.1 uncharacterized protein LOC122510581 [Leptopilina heterotoma]
MDGGSTEKLGGIGRNLENLEGWRTNSRIAIWSFVLFGSLILNATLLLAFVKRPGLRTISNRFVMNLTASNLLTCVLLAVLVILNDTTTAYTQSLCVISEGGSALVTTSSILTVLFIALDQYFAVVDPLRYRSRVDKIKCGLLIATVWIIAAIFASLAAFNPNPRSIWQSCEKQSNFTVQTFFDNFTSYLDITDDDNDNDDDYNFGKSLEELENTTAQLRAAFMESPRDYDPTILEFESTFRKIESNFTYGVVYSIGFGIFIYLIPFLTVCWIYISIYSAARKNSERTRRTGSRPILSSGSFCEDYCPIKQENSAIVVEEIRSKLPKISSLSSIDENIEPSQMTRSKSSELISSSTIQIEDEKQIVAAVIFTVGSQEVATQRNNESDNTKDTSKVAPPIASLKAKFLEDKTNLIDEQLKSKFPELNEQRRKSSHDLMYEEMILKRKLSCISDSCEESSEDDEEMLSFITNKELKVLNSIHNTTKEKLDIESQNNILSSNGEILIENRRYLNVSSIPLNGKCNSKISLASANTESSSTNLLSAPQNTPIVTITPPYKVPLHRISSIRSTSSYINSLKYKISNGSIFKYREETRAARISAIVIVMGLICWTPYVVVLIIGNLIDRNCLDLKNFNTIVLSFLVLATFVSPLLFGYRSKRVKRELRKFFCFRKELSYKNNRSLMAKKVLKRRHSGNLSQFEMESKYNILNCVYGKTKWPKDKVQFVQVPETALSVETCRSSFSSGASTQISSTSTDEC